MRADRLDNGNTLVLGGENAEEFNKDGNRVWWFSDNEINSRIALDRSLEGAQLGDSIERLTSGNTLIAISHPSAYAIEVTPERYISAIYLKNENGVSGPETVAGFDKLSSGDTLLAVNGHPVHGSSIMLVDDADMGRFERRPRGDNGYQAIRSIRETESGSRFLYAAWELNEVVEFDTTKGGAVQTLMLNSRPYNAEQIGIFNQPGKDRNLTPQTVIESGPSGTIENDDPYFSWSGSDPDGTVVGYYYQLDNGQRQFTTSSSQSFYNIGYGSHTLRVWAKDNYGAFDPTPDERSFYSKEPAPPPSEPPPIVKITSPSDGAVVDVRVITVSGTIQQFSGNSATLVVNGDRVQTIDVSNGSFSATVILTSGKNTIRVSATNKGGTRSHEITVTSTTKPTKLWVQLTWEEDQSDVDLYTTEPTGDAAWYHHKQNPSGGFLDVDNTKGYGPEHYYISTEEGHTVHEGDYVIRVHYFKSHGHSGPIHARVIVYKNERFYNEYTFPIQKDNSDATGPGNWDKDPDSWHYVDSIQLP